MSNAFEIGYHDTDFAFQHWSSNSEHGIQEWIQRMKEACTKCEDEEYKRGVLKRLEEYEHKNIL